MIDKKKYRVLVETSLEFYADNEDDALKRAPFELMREVADHVIDWTSSPIFNAFEIESGEKDVINPNKDAEIERLQRIIFNITHHEGAQEEMKEVWIPVVKEYGNRHLK